MRTSSLRAGALLSAMLLCAAAQAQSSSGTQALDATVRVRVISTTTCEPAEGWYVWAARKPFERGGEEFPLGLSGGEGIARAAYRSMQGVGEIVRTSASGEVELNVLAGTELWIAAMGPQGGDARGLGPLAAGQRASLVFELSTSSARCHGQVRERASGAPVADARVEGMLAGDEHVVAEAKTDSAGHFCLEAQITLDDVRITAPGFGATFAMLTHPARSTTFWLDRGAGLRGRVLEVDGSPVTGTLVRCTVSRYHFIPPETLSDAFVRGAPEDLETWTTATDAGGAFGLAGLPPRAWLLLELPDQRQPWSELYVLAPGEERELRIVPNARVKLHGLALDQDGKPAAGLTLRARRFAPEPESLDLFGTTAADGSFVFDGVRPGAWTLRPVSDPEVLGFAGAEQHLEVSIMPLEQSPLLQLERGSFLRGRVVGEHVSGAFVEVRASEGRFVREGRSEGDHFSIGPLPGDEYLVRASRVGQFTGPPVAARTGAQDIEVTVPPFSGSLEVEGKGSSSVEAVIFAHGRAWPARRASFGPDCVGGPATLEAGLYDVVASTEDLRLGRVEALAPTQERSSTPAELRPCATLRLVFTGPQLFARVVARAGGAVYASAMTTRGAACALLVPPGKVALELYPSETWPESPAGEPLVRYVDAVLDAEPEILVP